MGRTGSGDEVEHQHLGRAAGAQLQARFALQRQRVTRRQRLAIQMRRAIGFHITFKGEEDQGS